LSFAVEILEFEPARLLTLEIATTVERFQADLSTAFGTLTGALIEAGVKLAGPAVCAFLESADDPDRLLIAAGVPFEEALEPSDGMTIEDFPGGRALVGVHYGSYDELPRASVEMLEWVTESGYERSQAPLYQRYVHSMSDAVSPDELVTELVVFLA